jgi:hypothetical protein
MVTHTRDNTVTNRVSTTETIHNSLETDTRLRHVSMLSRPSCRSIYSVPLKKLKSCYVPSKPVVRSAPVSQEESRKRTEETTATSWSSEMFPSCLSARYLRTSTSSTRKSPPFLPRFLSIWGLYSPLHIQQIPLYHCSHMRVCTYVYVVNAVRNACIDYHVNLVICLWLKLKRRPWMQQKCQEIWRPTSSISLGIMANICSL